jgi:hypothetical protein
MLKFRDHWRPSPGRWEKGDGRVWEWGLPYSHQIDSK